MSLLGGGGNCDRKSLSSCNPGRPSYTHWKVIADIIQFESGLINENPNLKSSSFKVSNNEANIFHCPKKEQTVKILSEYSKVKKCFRSYLEIFRRFNIFLAHDFLFCRDPFI